MVAISMFPKTTNALNPITAPMIVSLLLGSIDMPRGRIIDRILSMIIILIESSIKRETRGNHYVRLLESKSMDLQRNLL